MKQEHEYRLETMRQQDAHGAQGPASGGGPRTVGGGRPLQPKSLRGGGGVNKSFNWGDGSAMNRSNSMGDENMMGGASGGGKAGGKDYICRCMCVVSITRV